MKKKLSFSVFVFTTVFCLLQTFSFAQTPSWAWAKSAGGNSTDYGKSVATDASGNVFVVGTFKSTSITFGTNTLTNPNISTFWGYGEDLFLVKYDANGNVLWAKNAGSIDNYSSSSATSVVTDPNGNVFIVGNYNGSIVFGNDTIYGMGMFITKIDGNGNIKWTKSNSGNNSGSVSDIAVNASGSSYATGYFSDSTITFGTSVLINDSIGMSDIYIVKYDFNGNVIWAKSAGGKNYDEAKSIATDSNDNIYLTGNFYSDTITFGTISLINDSAGTADIFVLKYDENGNTIWAKREGGNGQINSYSICTDLNNNVFVAGYFSSFTFTPEGTSITFDTTTLFAISGAIFLVKYNTNGIVQWAKSNDGPDYMHTPSLLKTDTSGNVFLSGYSGWGEAISFDSLTLANPSTGENLFLVKFSANGNTLWVKGSNNGSGEAKGVATDASGNIYLTGSFNTPSMTFDNSTVNCNWDYDMFLSKISKCGTSQGIDICLVTVDTATSTKNYIIWEKPVGFVVDSFRVYRQISSQYVHIGSVPYSAISEFVDTTNGINPKLTSYKYKISIVDTCGDEGPLSSYHQTMHFLVSPAIPDGFNLFWNDYFGFSFSQYYIWRDGNNSGNWQILDSVSFGITTYTDPTPPTDSARYWIEAVNPDGCNPTKASGHNSSRSNVQRNYKSSVPLLSNNNLNLKISPNPTYGKFTIQISDSKILNNKYQISISNIQGEIIYKSEIVNPNSQIDLSDQPSGLYIVSVKTGEKVYHQKLVKE